MRVLMFIVKIINDVKHGWWHEYNYSSVMLL